MPLPYHLCSVDYTEEAILNRSFPNPGEPAIGWRRFRIEYQNEDGYSNIEGTLYFPPGVDPYPVLDFIVAAIPTEFINENPF